MNFNFSDPMLFYSRRIGRAPQLPLDDPDFVDVPSATTNLGAAKLGGKLGNTTVGVMSAATAEEIADLDLGGTRSRRDRGALPPRTRRPASSTPRPTGARGSA